MPHEPMLTTPDGPHVCCDTGFSAVPIRDTRRRWAAAAGDLIDALLDGPGADRLGVLAECVAAASAADLTCAIVPWCRDQTGVTESGGQSIVGAARGLRAPQVTGLVFATTGSLSGRAFDDGRPFLVEGTDGVGGIGFGVGGGAPLGADSAVVLGPTMIVPLAGPHRPTVVITASRTRGAEPFTARDLAAASEFGRLACAALQVDSGYAERERQAIQRDRDRIGRDLHDRVVQRVFAAGLAVQAIGRLTEEPALRQRLTDQVEALDAVMAEIRSVVLTLSPPADTGRVSLRRGVLAVIEELRPLFPRPPIVAFSGAIDLLVPAELTDDVCAVLREGLTNVVRHARARETWVSATVTAQVLTVEISDDGVGPAGSNRRSGIASLSVRAERWQGMLALTDRRPHGTRLRWTASLPDVPDVPDVPDRFVR